MPLQIRQETLPGVGEKYEIDIDEHRSVAVVIHRNGRRELFYREGDERKDYEEILDLSDPQARTLGLFLVGAYYQPIATKLGQQSKSGEYVDWYSVDEGSPLVGTSREELGFEDEFDGTLLGIERDGDVHSTVEDDFILEAEDRLIVLGSDRTHRNLSSFIYE